MGYTCDSSGLGRNIAILHEVAASMDHDPTVTARIGHIDAKWVHILEHIMVIESGGDNYCEARTSSAKSLFQILTKDGPHHTSEWTGLVHRYPHEFSQASYMDPYQNCRGAIYITAETIPALRRTLGRDPTAGEIYLSWFAGMGGAAKILRASPGTPCEAILGPDAAAANDWIRHMTAGEMAAWAEKKMSLSTGPAQDYAKAEAAAAAQVKAPPPTKSTDELYTIARLSLPRAVPASPADIQSPPPGAKSQTAHDKGARRH